MASWLKIVSFSLPTTKLDVISYPQATPNLPVDRRRIGWGNESNVTNVEEQEFVRKRIMGRNSAHMSQPYFSRKGLEPWTTHSVSDFCTFPPMP